FKILSFTDNTAIRSIQIVINENNQLSIKNIINDFKRVSQVVVFSSKIEKVENFKDLAVIIYTKEIIKDEQSCGKVSPKNFICNIPFYTESINNNTCLNKKISIDKAGNIKNCPSMTYSYGNIENMSIKETLNNENLKKYWTVN